MTWQDRKRIKTTRTNLRKGVEKGEKDEKEQKWGMIHS